MEVERSKCITEDDRIYRVCNRIIIRHEPSIQRVGWVCCTQL